MSVRASGRADAVDPHLMDVFRRARAAGLVEP